MLVVTAESDGAMDELEQSIEAIGTVEKHLQFGALRVKIQQEQIETLCELGRIESIKTENAVGFSGDAGEDV